MKKIYIWGLAFLMTGVAFSKDDSLFYPGDAYFKLGGSFVRYVSYKISEDEDKDISEKISKKISKHLAPSSGFFMSMDYAVHKNITLGFEFATYHKNIEDVGVGSGVTDINRDEVIIDNVKIINTYGLGRINLHTNGAINFLTKLYDITSGFHIIGVPDIYLGISYGVVGNEISAATISEEREVEKDFFQQVGVNYPIGTRFFLNIEYMINESTNNFFKFGVVGLITGQKGFH